MIRTKNGAISAIRGNFPQEITKVRSNGKLLFDNTIPMGNLLAYYNAYGRTNQDADRDLWKDKWIYGYDLNLNNVAYTPSSGWGGEPCVNNDWSNFVNYNTPTFTTTITQNSISTISKSNSWSSAGFARTKSAMNIGMRYRFKVRISGLDAYRSHGGSYMYFARYTTETTGPEPLKNISTDGVYEIDIATTDAKPVLHLILNRGTYDYTLYDDTIIIENLPDYPNALVTDGIDDFCQSVKVLPAFKDNNYSAVLDFDILEQNNGGILLKDRLYLYLNGSNKKINFWNINGGPNIQVPQSTFAFTNNKAYDRDGNVYINTNEVLNDLSTYLKLGVTGQNIYAKLAIRSLSIWNGTNCNFEQCANILQKMQNNTLI